MTLVLGVDGGGSKTHAMVADERGETLGFASSGRSNLPSRLTESTVMARSPSADGAGKRCG